MPRSAVAGPSCKANGAPSPPPLLALSVLPRLPPRPPLLPHTPHSAALVCRPESSDGDALQPPTQRASFERLLLLLFRPSSVRPETFSISPLPTDIASQSHADFSLLSSPRALSASSPSSLSPLPSWMADRWSLAWWQLPPHHHRRRRRRR